MKRTRTWTENQRRPTTSARKRVRLPPRPQAAPKSNAIERKYIDTDVEVADMTAQWNVFCLNAVATGDSYDTRDGRKAVMKSIQLRGTMSNYDGGVLQRHHRMILFVDKQNSSNNPVGAGAPATAEMALLLKDETDSHSMLDPSTSGRFQILKDWSFSLGLNDGTTGYCQPPVYKDIKLYKKINVPTLYSGTGATAASINDKAIYLAVMNTVASAGTGSKLYMNARVRFIDV